MKTMKIFFALSLAMILFAFNSNNVNAGSKKTTGIIKYQVIVHVDPNFNQTSQMIVYIADEKGRYVAHPQIFDKENNMYGFAEPGPKSGTRIASVALYPDDGTKLDVSPDIQKGTFEGGVIYTFNVYIRSDGPQGAVAVSL